MGTVLGYIRDVALVDDDSQLSLLKSLRMSKIYEYAFSKHTEICYLVFLRRSASKMFALPDSGWFNQCVQELSLRLLEEATEVGIMYTLNSICL